MVFIKQLSKQIKITSLLFFLVYSTIHLNAQTIIDSLLREAEKTKPGWDQIDMTIGLGRLYTNASYYNKAREQVKNIYKWSIQHNIPTAKAYALILEGSIADGSLDDADTAITFYKEAIDIAKATNNKDALAYATNEYCKILIWNKGDTQKGIKLLFGLLEDMDATVSIKNEGTIHASLAHAYLLLGDYDKSLNYFDKALTIFEDIRDNPPVDPKLNRVSAQLAKPTKHIGFLLNDMGNLYLKKGNTAKAMSYKKLAFTAIEKTNTTTHMAWMHVNLSKMYSVTGDYGTALEYIEKARKMYEARKLYADMAWVDAIMTNTFLGLKDYDMAEVYSKNNLDYLERANPNSHYYGGTLLKMVEIQLGKEDFTKAASYLEQAELKINKTDNSGNKALLLRYKGEVAIKSERYDEAKNFLKQAIQFNKTRGFSPETAICEFNLATVFFKQNLLDSSMVYATNVLSKVERSKDIDLAKNCYELLSLIYGAKGDYKSAFKNQEAFLKFNDSIYTSDAVSKLKTEQVRQDVISFKNQKELAEQNAGLLEERNKLYAVLGVILLCVLAMMAYFYVNLRKAKVKTQYQNTQLTQLNQTKDKFFGIIAHDLRNPLLGLQTVGSQINYFIRKKQPEKLIELSGHVENSTKKLTELLDNLLNWALLQNGMIPYHPTEVNLKDVANDVVDLLKPMANTKQISLINTIKEDSFVHADSKAVNTILRNIVSNALKFTEADGEVRINIKNEKHQSIITINDTGTGISAEQIPKLFNLGNQSKYGTSGEEGSGLGLILCKELVELNKGTIKVISTLGKGSSFIFKFPKTPALV